jgi:hypothetical protein
VLVTQSNSLIITTWVGYSDSWKDWLFWEFGKRGEEFKVPYYASAAVARNGNLPQLALNNGHLPLFPTIRYIEYVFYIIN